MADIAVLQSNTIDKIAAGEVVERPFNVVKELVENAIDAKSTSIHVEIVDGGSTLIRVTDNGCGIPSKQVEIAFYRHATSKIKEVEDLETIQSLGFRGEALSSIASISRLTCITKTEDEMMACSYELTGGNDGILQYIGAPTGTTILVKDLFFNTPVRRKFLKSHQVEGSYITELLEHLALSRPDIAFQYTINHKVKFYTTGNGSIKEVIYQLYGMEMTKELIEIDVYESNIKIHGFIGKPTLTRHNRSYEHYFINGRYLKSSIMAKAIEHGFRNHLMQHRYPFTMLYIEMDPRTIDINIHPSKMEIKFMEEDIFYQCITKIIEKALTTKELIPEVTLQEPVKEKPVSIPKQPEPFEVIRHEQLVFETKEPYVAPIAVAKPLEALQTDAPKTEVTICNSLNIVEEVVKPETPIFLSKEANAHYEILGQIFKTYWLIAYDDKLYIMDQHAAHEKIKYERLLAKLTNSTIDTQQLLIPIIVSLSPKEDVIYQEHAEVFEKMGFSIAHFGGREYSMDGIPMELFGGNEKDVFFEVLQHLEHANQEITSSYMLHKCASIACKAAVKGNTVMSKPQVSALLEELLTLENPYQCPHGRPTIITMTQYELEKKFKRIV